MSINVKIEPSITVDAMGFQTSPDKSDTEDLKKGFTQYALIKINGRNINWEDVQVFELDSTSFIPTLKLVFLDVGEIFTGITAIKNGDIVSTFIREPSSKIKPIRIDFYITNATPQSNTPEPTKIFIKGIIHVPNLWKPENKAINNTSYVAFQEIAQNCQLGFATNIDSTSDKMIWISTFQTNYEFIKHITEAGYVDDASFLTSFIDVYYNLNYIEVNREFPPLLDVKKFEEVVMEVGGINVTSDYMLFNNITSVVNELSFTNPKLIDDSGEISLLSGYKYNMSYYDLVNDSFQEFTIDPLTTKGNEEYFNRRGRLSEDYFKDIIKYNYFGEQTSNTHSNFKYAKINNKQNLTELKKTRLQFDVRKPNLSTYRYQQVAVMFIKDFSDESEATSLNLYLSGNYLVDGFKYIKMPNGELGHRIYLTRREWPNEILK